MDSAIYWFLRGLSLHDKVSD